MMVALFVLLNGGNASAQLQMQDGTTLTNWTPDSLVRNVLLGEGVEVYNVKFNGSLTSINCDGVGKFTTGAQQTNLGMSEGIVLSASSLAYVNSTSGASTSTCNSYTDADLTNLSSPNSTNNVALLEFDFVPRSDSIKFRYVFASEEYYGYECTQFNDVFAFFLSGVNPNGGMYSAKNIALVPGTETPVTISTIFGTSSYGTNTPCDPSNGQYFVNNQSQTYVKHMDGFTTVLTAEARVVPCQTYHLKMAVCNASDQSLPSCVFLEANSLTSNAISFNFINAANPTATSDLYEGCEATIQMSRPQQSSTSTRINVEFEGTATNGVDFAIMNPYYYFPANTDTFQLVLSPYMDGIAEGNGTGIETAKFVLSAENGCPRSDSVEFNIIDVLQITDSIWRDTLTSSSPIITLHSVITGGMPNRTITWTNLMDPSSQARTGDSIVVNTYPNDALWLCYVQDACGNYASDTMLVGIRRNFAYALRDTFGTGPTRNLMISDTILCAGEPLKICIHGADSCIWTTSLSNTPFNTRDTIVTVFPDENIVYRIRSYYWWNGQYWEDNDSVRVIAVPLPEVHVSADKERLCQGQSVTISATGTANFSWDNGDTFVTSASHVYTPDTTSMFVIMGLTAGAECYGKDSILITVDTVPAIAIEGTEGVCGGEDAELTLTTTAESFTWTANPPDPSLGGQETRTHIIINPASTTVYTVNAVNGTCSNSKSTTVNVEQQPVAIGEVTPKTVKLGETEAVFSDLSKNATSRRWEFPDGEVFTTKDVHYVVPNDVDSITVRLWAYNPYMCFDTTTVTVYVDHTTLWVPNAFTPDESTNRTFEVIARDIQRYHLVIYDRRGQMVFESFDLNYQWDGTSKNGEKCPQGAYSYIVSCHKITYPFEQIVQHGTVVVIR